MSKFRTGVCVALTCAIGWLPVCAQPETEVQEQQGVALTIYNQNFGVVKDDRKVVLKPGMNVVKFTDVASQIDPTTVSLQSLTAPNSLAVREQNYQYDLINPQAILAKSVGKTLKFRRFFDNGTVREFTGTLISSPESSSSNLVIRTADGIILEPVGQIEVSELPSGLISKPTLVWRLETSKPGDNTVEVAYQTQGINWKSDYVAVLNKDDTQLDTLNSWVTLDNRSGATYKEASLKLMAGDVHRVVDPGSYTMRAKGAMTVNMGMAPQPQFTEASFAEYHLYTLQGKTTVRDNETKQMSLFTADKIPANKLFVFEPRNGDSKKVNVKIEVTNSQKNNMGMPLPAGTVRIYKKDADGALEFIGEDHIDHTPKDEKVRLYIGDAFDVVGERKVMDQSSSGSLMTNRSRKEAIEITLHNHKDVPITVLCVEHPYAWDWTVSGNNVQFDKKSSTQIEFPVKIAANSDAKLNYTIEYHY